MVRRHANRNSGASVPIHGRVWLNVGGVVGEMVAVKPEQEQVPRSQGARTRAACHPPRRTAQVSYSASYLMTSRE